MVEHIFTPGFLLAASSLCGPLPLLKPCAPTLCICPHPCQPYLVLHSHFDLLPTEVGFPLLHYTLQGHFLQKASPIATSGDTKHTWPAVPATTIWAVYLQSATFWIPSRGSSL